MNFWKESEYLSVTPNQLVGYKSKFQDLGFWEVEL